MKLRFTSITPEVFRRMKFCLIALATLSALFLLFACGPSGPREGTPAFYWAAAREAFAAGDFARTSDDLDRVLQSDNEFTSRALPWALLVTSGLANGYMDLVEQYEAGAKVNKEIPGTFYKFASSYRPNANQLTLRFAELFDTFDKTKDDPVTLDFPFPPGSSADVPQLAIVAKGTILPAATADTAVQLALARGILVVVTRAAGAAGDTAKAEQALKANGGKVPRATFAVAMARTLYESAELYSKNEMNDPDKMNNFYQRAQAVIDPLPESFDKRDLQVSIRLASKAPPR